jgi:chromosome segregation ATPase
VDEGVERIRDIKRTEELKAKLDAHTRRSNGVEAELEGLEETAESLREDVTGMNGDLEGRRGECFGTV